MERKKVTYLVVVAVLCTALIASLLTIISLREV